ncbi:MAG: hypothetical protein I8H91_06240 [Burkholderiales bacterium]|nr:hypothetical protein [Burkholderiales bacterium]
MKITAGSQRPLWHESMVDSFNRMGDFMTVLAKKVRRVARADICWQLLRKTESCGIQLAKLSKMQHFFLKKRSFCIKSRKNQLRKDGIRYLLLIDVGPILQVCLAPCE